MSFPTPRSTSGDNGANNELLKSLKIIDISHIAETEADDRAQKVIHEETQVESTKKGWARVGEIFKEMPKNIQNAPKKIWDDMTKNYRRNRELQTIRHRMTQEDSLYAGKTNTDRDDSMHSDDIQAILRRFDVEAPKEEVLTAGEFIDKLNVRDDRARDLRNEIFDLIETYAGSNMDDNTFAQMKKDAYDKFFHNEKRPNISLYADNALDIAKAIKTGVLHLDSLKHIDDSQNIVIGRARSKFKTEATYTMFDRSVDFLQRSPITDKIPPDVISLGVAAAFGVTSLAKNIATGLTRVVTLGLAGAATVGLTKGIVENKRLKDERAEVSRSLARGEVFSPEAKRRKEMEGFVMDMKGADEFIDAIEQHFDEHKNIRGDITPEQQTALLASLSELEGRFRFNDTNKVDTISYRGPEGESLHTKLVILRAEAKVKLRNKLGLSKEDFQQQLDQQAETFLTDLAAEKEEKDTLEKHFRREKRLRAGLKGAAIGFVGGAVAQELFSFINPSMEGLAEHSVSNVTPNEETQSTLRAIYAWATNEVAPGTNVSSTSIQFASPDHMSSIPLPDGGNLALNLAKDLDVVHRGGSSFLSIPGGKEIPLGIDPSTGSFDATTLAALRNEGLQDMALQRNLESTTVLQSTTRSISAQDYIAAHKNEPGWHAPQKKFWYGNDTPMHLGADGKMHGADFNELRGYRGGVRGKGFLPDGSAQMRIDMKEFTVDVDGNQLEGSQQAGNYGMPAKALKEGRMFWQLTPIKDGPTYRIPFHVGLGGKVTAEIDPSNPIYQMCIGTDEHGNMVRKAFLSEIVEVPKSGDKGTLMVYASRLGKDGLGNVMITEDVPVETTIMKNAATITRAESVTVSEMLPGVTPDAVPIIPLYDSSRKELERAVAVETITYNGESSIPVEKQKLFEERRSPTLKENPNAVLDHRKEIKRYLDTLSPEYRKLVNELGTQIDLPMGDDVRIVSCIPVAGHQEGKNIYETLKNYTYQTMDRKQFEIVLLVNHPDRDKQGKEVTPDETIQEIERFKKEFPDMPVRMMYYVVPQKDAQIGHIRKLLTDAVLERHMARGNKAKDLIMVSNDADNKGVAPEYFDGFVNNFDRQPEVDLLLGNLDWDPEAYTRYPDVFVGTRLFQYLNTMGRKRYGGLASSGANTAFKSSIYAGIGGYLSELPGGEDVAIGQAIAQARGTIHTRKFSGRSLLYTSARRSIDALEKKGLAPVQQWDSGFGAFDALRKNDLRRDIDINYEDPTVLESLKKRFEYVINATLESYEGGKGIKYIGKDAKAYKICIEALGIHYKINANDGVEITDMTSLIERLKQYKHLAVLKRDLHSGKPGKQEEYTAKRKEFADAENEKNESITTEYEQGIQEFLATNAITLETKQYRPDIAPLLNDSQVTQIGNFDVIDSSTFKQDELGNTMRYARKDGKIFVVKELQNISKKEETNLPNSVPDVESYLKDNNVQDSHLGLPVEILNKDGKTYKFYDLENVDLYKYLKDKPSLDPKNSVSITLRITTAISELHKNNIIHGDVSLNNILLSDTDATLIDIDAANYRSGKFGVRTKIRGNRFILAPEMMKASKAGIIRFDKTVDVYSATANLYKMLTGQFPIIDRGIEKMVAPTDPVLYDKFHHARMERYRKLHEEGIGELPDSIPEPLRPIIKKGLNPTPAGRYQSIEAFAIDLMNAYKQL